MNSIFADSGHWIAVVYPKDALHSVASAATSTYRNRQIVTSEMVLVEVLNFFSGLGNNPRQTAIEYATNLRADPGVRIIPQSPELFAAAFRLYSDRPDKGWSLTDCASFVICAGEGITEALAHDIHFQKAGITPLLRQPV